jgi:hypothetical protein
LAPSYFHLFGPLKTTLVADVSLMTKRLKGRCGSGGEQSKDLRDAGFDAVVKRWDKCVNVGGGYVEK